MFLIDCTNELNLIGNDAKPNENADLSIDANPAPFIFVFKIFVICPPPAKNARCPPRATTSNVFLPSRDVFDSHRKDDPSSIISFVHDYFHGNTMPKAMPNTLPTVSPSQKAIFEI